MYRQSVLALAFGLLALSSLAQCAIPSIMTDITDSPHTVQTLNAIKKVAVDIFNSKTVSVQQVIDTKYYLTIKSIGGTCTGTPVFTMQFDPQSCFVVDGGSARIGCANASSAVTWVYTDSKCTTLLGSAPFSNVDTCNNGALAQCSTSQLSGGLVFDLYNTKGCAGSTIGKFSYPVNLGQCFGGNGKSAKISCNDKTSISVSAWTNNDCSGSAAASEVRSGCYAIDNTNSIKISQCSSAASIKMASGLVALIFMAVAVLFM